MDSKTEGKRSLENKKTNNKAPQQQPSHPESGNDSGYSLSIIRRKSLALSLPLAYSALYMPALAVEAPRAELPVRPAPVKTNSDQKGFFTVNLASSEETKQLQASTCSGQYGDYKDAYANAKIFNEGLDLTAALVEKTAKAALGSANALNNYLKGNAEFASSLPYPFNLVGKSIKAGLNYIESGLDGVLAATNTIQATQVYRQIAFFATDRVVQSKLRWINSLPGCNTQFKGTLEVLEGGLQATGDSYFNGDVGITNGLSLGGTLYANRVITSQGISALGGKITLGNPSLDSYSEGIALGGGSLAGAGFGGLPAFSGHVDALAIGNNARALQAGSIALGLNSYSSSPEAIAIGTKSRATGAKAIALGSNSNASEENSIAIGAESFSSGVGSTAVGTGSRALESASIAIGLKADSNAQQSIAIGPEASANGDSTIAIGSNTISLGQGAVSLGKNAGSYAKSAISIGEDASAFGIESLSAGFKSLAVGQGSLALGRASGSYGADAVAIGSGSQSYGSSAVAIGTSSRATKSGGLAMGNSSFASEIDAIALGSRSVASGDASLAFGRNARALKADSIAIGPKSTASGEAAMALGYNSRALKEGAISLGREAKSLQLDAVALGSSSSARGERDIVVGANSATYIGGKNTVVGSRNTIRGSLSSGNNVVGSEHQMTGRGNSISGRQNSLYGNRNIVSALGSEVRGFSAVAIGNRIRSSGRNAIAMGREAATLEDHSIAIGARAKASAYGSVAFGKGAQALRDSQFTFGNRLNSYTAPGITSDRSRQRQSGELEVVTSDSRGNLATDKGQIFDSIMENQAGIAIAMSLANPTLGEYEKFGIAINWGAFQSSHALGVSIVGLAFKDVIAKDKGRISYSLGAGVSVSEISLGGRATKMQTGGRAGLQFTW